jgi:hypothetical protein
MRDPSDAIYNGFKNLLTGNLTYGGRTFLVYIDDFKVSNNQLHQVLISDLELLDNGDKDHFISNCSLLIEVIDGGYQQRPRRSILDNIGNQITQLIMKRPVLISGFSLAVSPHVESITHIKEEGDNTIILRKLIRINFDVEQLN